MSINNLLPATLHLLSKGIPHSNNLSILIYHRVLDAQDSICPDEFDKPRFIKHLQILSKYFNVLSLTEALEKLGSNTLSKNSAVITFDDGYADNYFNALPILKSFNMPATFFIATGYLNGRSMWNDIIANAIRKTSKSNINLSKLNYGVHKLTNKKLAFESIIKQVKYEPSVRRDEVAKYISNICEVNLPTGLMMNESQVAHMFKQGMEIGGHTVNHPILCELDSKSAKHEINQCKSDLESIINEKISLFAYPNGKPNIDYNFEHTKIVKNAGFTSACSTTWGTSNQNTDLYQIPRFTPWNTEQTKFLVHMYKNRLRSVNNQLTD